MGITSLSGLTKTSQKRNLSESLVNSQIITNHHTVLLHAVSEGHFEICKLLIGHTDDPNPHDDLYQDTALHVAAENGRTEIFKYIMERSGGSNRTNLREITPLHKAVENGSVEIAKLIIEDANFLNGADLNGFTPLHLALDGYDQPEIAELIIESLIKQSDNLDQDLYSIARLKLYGNT